ncbi:hypothetical protein Q3G72_013434 [Acer saccharum]|nr:hypothetical protein Q3G72_013434 [Acer saccharum]
MPVKEYVHFVLTVVAIPGPLFPAECTVELERPTFVTVLGNLISKALPDLTWTVIVGPSCSSKDGANISLHSYPKMAVNNKIEG